MTTMSPPDYAHWLQSLKEQIRTARIKASLAVNSELIRLYWRISTEIVARCATRNWGTKVLEQLAKDLHSEFPDMKGLSRTNLKYMAQFAEAAMGQQLVDPLPWGQNIVLMTQLSDRPTREWYIKKTIEHGWSRSVLALRADPEQASAAA